MILAIAVILGFGIFFRSYHFSDWMHFELDQSRDSLVVSKAYENGAGELPLLGPRARGTFLRLGPAFYYLEYISARIFGNTPPAMAYSTLFFSILSLPLFFLFCREYFSRTTSLMLLAVFSSSIFMVMYSRFPWNPNSLPFFILLFLYSLLKLASPEEKRKEWWLVISALALSIGTQLHFLAFVSFPIVALVFIIWKHPKLKLYSWITALAVIFVFYSPMIINEMETGGDNAKEFIEAVSGKSTNDKSSIFKKAAVDYLEHSKNFVVILTGVNAENFLDSNNNGGIEIAVIKAFNLGKYNPAFCLGIVGTLFLAGGFVLLVNKARSETNIKKKNFLMLSGLWFVLMFMLFVPLATDLSPRFFLLTAFIPFIFLGLFLEKMLHPVYKLHFLIFAIVAILIISNLLAVKNRFTQLALASTRTISIGEDPILKESTRVTYGQEKMITQFMEEKSRKNNYPVYYNSDSRYRPAFEYMLKKDKIIFDEISKNHVYEKGNYFVVALTVTEENFFLGELAPKFDITEKRKFGTLTVLTIMPRKDAITEVEQDFSEPKKKARSRAPKRYTWNEVFGKGSSGEDEDDDSESGL